MTKSIRRLLSTSVLIVALALPTAAAARFTLQGSATPGATAATAASRPTRVAAPAQPAAQGFHWGDAALGAAAGLTVSIVLGLGVGAQRRRAHHPLAS